MSQHLIDAATEDLFTTYNFPTKIKYSGKFKGYNANITKSATQVTFGLSRQWEEVSDDIKVGLLQELFVKMFKLKSKPTYNMELYHIFLKKVHLAIPKTKSDPVLKTSFDRVNDIYLAGMLDTTNLQWGTHSTHKLGSYDFGSDTITISRILEEDEELLDYVMYHEMLHKKHQFTCKNGRTQTHSKAFREDERKFKNQPHCEKRLSLLATNHKIKQKVNKSVKKTKNKVLSFFGF